MGKYKAKRGRDWKERFRRLGMPAGDELTMDEALSMMERGAENNRRAVAELVARGEVTPEEAASLLSGGVEVFGRDK